MAMPDRVAELKELVELNYHCTAEHIRSAVVREHLGCGRIWEGVVEVFALREFRYPASRCYAWLEETASCTMLELGPVNSPQTAIRTALREMRNYSGPLSKVLAEAPNLHAVLGDVAVVRGKTFAFNCERSCHG